MTAAVFAHAKAFFDPDPVQFWTPYPKQAAAVALAGEVFELLYGGAAGGGKSAMLRGYACDFAVKHPGAHIGIVRRTLPMLKQTHGLHLPVMTSGHAVHNKSEFTFTFVNGSVIRFISLQNEGDEQNYKSAEFDLLLFDEVTELTENQYTFMTSRVRSARGHRAHIVATANPEGRGFRWVKRRWVQPWKGDLAEGQAMPQPGIPWAPPKVVDGVVTGWQPYRAFLPATVYDNPGLLASNPQYVSVLESLPDGRLRRALLDGDWTAMDAVPGALWRQDVLDDNRVESIEPGDLVRVVVAIDPNGTSAKGDSECGILVAGRTGDGHFYVLADYSGPYGPDEWAEKAAWAYRFHKADRVIAEINYGGEMVVQTLKAADASLPVKVVTASRGKAIRAEPISVLTTRKRVHLVGRWADLEDQLCTWTQDSGWSPDRLDAFVWAVTELAGGASGLAFLTQLSAPCPECKTLNTVGRPACVRCGAELPNAVPADPAALPAPAEGEAAPDAGAAPPGEGEVADPDPPPDGGGSAASGPPTRVVAGLILPG